MGRTSDARDRLVESGQGLMHEKGYTAVGVSEVCARAGVNKGSFYHFFPSKRELGLAVIDAYGSAESPSLDALVEGSAPPLERLRNHLESNYRRHKEMRAKTGRMLGCPLGNLALEMSTQDPELRRRIREVFEGHVDRFESVLVEAVERGDLPAIDTRRAARALMSLIEGALMLAKMSDDPELLRGVADDAMRLIGADVSA